MSKSKSTFVCQECGYESSGWLGKCPACEKWNTFVEQLHETTHKSASQSSRVSTPVNINEIILSNEERYSTGINEMDRVLGGGIVRGSLVLVGGDPGIGKSTLILQMCNSVKINAGILYISGEESVNQIKIRAERLEVKSKNLMMVSETNFSAIKKIIEKDKPKLVIIDSIQTMYNDEMSSSAGSISQVRDVTAGLMRLAKESGVAVIVVGHVTKEGAIAGPRVLEHMVDTVLYFEGDKNLYYRVLRSVKNRFGSTNEIGIFEMRDCGLVEVENPSMVMLSGRQVNVPGSVVISSIEGTRPMLIEIQALVCSTNFGIPRRMATGIDFNRITMLMAVLEKKVGMELHNYDAYVNVVGGLKLSEPACDLGVATAVASSFKNKPIDIETVLIGEVGLTGEVRAVNRIENRIMEASRNGFKNCIIPADNMKQIQKTKAVENITIKPVRDIKEVLELLFY